MQVRRTVRQLLQDKGFTVLSIHPDATVFEALEQMAANNVGSLVVFEDDAIVGIFSERDYARKVILHGHASRQLKVRAVMSGDLVTVGPEQHLTDCMRLMTDHRVRHLPVLEGGRLIGVVSIGDVVKAVMAEQEFLIDQLQSYIAGATR
ncbi:MAG TPA: CBS domain-containing protein [Trueperaceae bacterium]|nr:CBS domain-containing protein [Trueperaceae bacterium]